MAAARMGLRTALFSFNLDLIAQMSCNPAIGGIAKGSGMIHPDMGTMFAFLTTDVAVTPAALQSALTRAMKTSFEMITVDGDMSTNDAVFLLASTFVFLNFIVDVTYTWLDPRIRFR